MGVSCTRPVKSISPTWWCSVTTLKKHPKRRPLPRSSLLYSLGDIASWVGGSVVGESAFEVERVRSLGAAGPHDLAFLAHPRYRADAEASSAGALLLAKPLDPPRGRAGWHQLVVDDSHRALATILDRLTVGEDWAPGIDPSSIVAGGAMIDPQATIGPLCTIGERARIGAGTVLVGQVAIGSEVVVGADSVLFPMVSVYPRCLIGNRVRLHSGVVIGGDGFGYVSDASGHKKIRHQGTVVVEDDVEVGANTTVDRALLEDTVIGAGTKIDNLVQVGHNAQVGRDNLIVAGSAIAGSATLGDRVVMGGHAGVSGHLTVGDDVQIASKCALYEDAEPGTKWGGVPGVPLMEWKKTSVRLRRLGELEQRVRDLEKLVNREDADETQTEEH